MPRFLAVYTMKPEDLVRFRALPKAEQDAVDAAGLKQWVDWQKANAASFPDEGGMVGKTKRVSKDGISDAQNAFCGCGAAVREPSAFHNIPRRRSGYHAVQDRASGP